ncbi:ABC transporter ATP-binding protein [Paenibacillus woosongensis]|uniref:ABC transporter ATP-binding protein n=1 Tax=Paenibacillus woosongensis TaxID=307580 RepID=A0AA95KXX0_9BACL|nr:ABC transporter ATP-binding protein [Paenibacillus woosongensis]WHX51565.1 ABC transporter ATP-binding protein [Paenibacillus woosongensis]
MLEIKDLSVNYGVIAAVKQMNLHIRPGEIVALIGTNGSGKTSALRSISGLNKSIQGQIRFEGQEITKLEPHQIVERGISQVPEGRGVFPDLTVLENLKLGAYVRNDKTGIAADIQGMFELFPRLEERKKQLAGTMSGGEQQMLAIARALMARPKLLLLDEPSMGLAPLIVKEIFAAIRKVNEEGVSILLVEQNATMALATAHRGYVMETGSIVVEGDAAELRNNDVVKSVYLGIG